MITGPDSFMVSLNETSSFSILVEDTNLVSFTIISGDVEGGDLSRDENDTSLYTFTWTPTGIIESPIVFLATDDIDASSQYTPQIEFCQCQNGSNCTLDGVLNQLANPVDLNCICSGGEYQGGLRGRGLWKIWGLEPPPPPPKEKKVPVRMQ